MLNNENFLDKIGITSKISWGYLGVLIFMMGDGLELAFISPYLVDQGLSVTHTSALVTGYGVMIAIASWFSGVLIDMFGARKVMLWGLIAYIVGHSAFVGFGVTNVDFFIMFPTYMLRGIGYPLFAYGFLVWITYRTPQKRLGKAVGWFWFVFSGGMNVLGAGFSAWAVSNLGYINTLWSSIFWVLLGGFFALVLNRDKLERTSTAKGADQLKELARGITIVVKEPKVGVAGIVRIINQAAQYAFPLFLPTYLATFGIPTETWLVIWSSIFISNIAFNLIFGVVGDKLGWRNTIMWVGGVGCGIFTLALYYVPQIAGGNIVLLTIVGIIWGACLAGYVPISALVPSLVKEDKGAAMSILNLGAGLCVFVGPAIVTVFYGLVGPAGVTWILSGLYFASTIMMIWVKLPNNARTLDSVESSESATTPS